MKKQTRRKFSPAFKVKVALEAVKKQQTLAELAKEFDVNSVMISKWKAEFLENLSATFERTESAEVQEQDTEKLYSAIGQLKVENKFLKKVARNWGYRSGGSVGDRSSDKAIHP